MHAISGAGGMLYAKRLLEALPASYDTLYVTATENALRIISAELGVDGLTSLIPISDEHKFTLLSSTDVFSPPASGSHDYEGLVIAPCSMGMVGRIAAGVSNDLVTRAADVCLKERRKLILLVREMPLSLIHLRNMTALAEAGAQILPASPGFYSNPRTIADLVDFVVDRILRCLGSEERLTQGWGE